MKTNKQTPNTNHPSIDVSLLGKTLMKARSSDDGLYLDTATGRPAWLTAHGVDLYHRDKRGEAGQLTEELQNQLSTAKEILHDESGRFVPLSGIEPLTELIWMENFSHFVTRDRLREQLQKILDVSEKIAAFNEALSQYPEERNLWSMQRSSQTTTEAANVLAEIGIEDGEEFVFEYPK